MSVGRCYCSRRHVGSGAGIDHKPTSCDRDLFSHHNLHDLNFAPRDGDVPVALHDGQRRLPGGVDGDHRPARGAVGIDLRAGDL